MRLSRQESITALGYCPRDAFPYHRRMVLAVISFFIKRIAIFQALNYHVRRYAAWSAALNTFLLTGLYRNWRFGYCVGTS